MQLRVLGCSGGIGQHLRTSSFLVDEDILLDAGTGVGDMSLEAMRQLRHLFITHSHMDHIASIPLLVDTLFSELNDHQQPLVVHARQETIDSFKKHIFNWEIWPDFTELPTKHTPVLEFKVMKPGDVAEVNGRRIEMIEVNHTVPAVAYAVRSDDRVLVYSGDTTANDTLWQVLNGYDRVDFMVIESAFANHDLELAKLAHHYCPSLLADDLRKLKHNPRLGISHLKPGEEQAIMSECRTAIEAHRELLQLSSGDLFQI
jgi:ribonuclease BN (tRNA processing enzyme)